MVSFVDKQLQSMTSAAADLGSVKMRIELQENFVNKLTDSLDKGIGRLVDAEMNEESTKLKALQTQQQTGCSGPVDRQQRLAEHPVALPLIGKDIARKSSRIRKGAAFSVMVKRNYYFLIFINDSLGFVNHSGPKT